MRKLVWGGLLGSVLVASGACSGDRDFGAERGAAGASEAGSPSSLPEGGSDAVAQGGSSDGGSTTDGGEPHGLEGGAAGSASIKACGDRNRCAPAAPEGWEGPFSTDLTDSVPECPAEFPDLAYEGGSAPANEPAKCGACKCEDCTGGSCAVRFNFFSEGTCSTSAGMVTPKVSSCAQKPIAATHVKLDHEKTLDTVECEVTMGSTDVKPPRWLDRVRLCGGQAVAEGCDTTEVCIPALGEPEQLCIVAAGNKSCPSGYPERQVLNSGFEDTRACDCKCTENMQCASGQSLMRNTCGSTQTYTILAVDACTAIPANQPMYTAAAATGTPIATAKAVPVGTLEAAGSITVCCLP